MAIAGRYGLSEVWKVEPSNGIGLRDWFAGLALSAMSAPFEKNERPKDRARAAYRLADAMLAERNK